MKSLLVAYATTDGHARKVAEYVAAAFNRMGREVDLIDAASPAAASVTPIYAAAVIAGSVHFGDYQPALQDFVKRNVGWLNASPAAFLSVSLAAALDDEASRADCRACEQKFPHETGLVPGVVLPVAGALPYTQLDWFRRFAVKMVMKRHGGDTDTSQDFEYTDWEALGRFATEFVDATAPNATRQGERQRGVTMKGFIRSIEDIAVANDEFRRVLYTGKYCQLVVMALKAGEEIGAEVHGLDQFFRVEEGTGEAVLDGVRTSIQAGFGIVVPAGARHNIINTGNAPLKLYTLYAPPNHRDGVVHRTRAEAEADTEEFDGRTTE